MTALMKSVRSWWGLLVVCGICIVLADWLFYRQYVGWTLGLYSLLILGLLVLRRGVRSQAGWLAAGLTLLLAFALLEEPTFLGVLMMIAALGFAVMLRNGNWSSSFTYWITRWAHLLALLPARFLLDNYLAARWFRRHPESRPAVERMVFRWVLPLLGGLVFVGLFTAANPVIGNWMSSIWERLEHWLEWLPEFLRPGRILLWLLVGTAVYGVLRHQIWSRRKDAGVTAPPVQSAGMVSHELAIRCLLVFNVVFAVQSLLDVIYLYGGMTLPKGMTYAHYAHRGAYPLVATALLAGLFVLMSFRTGGAAHRSVWARRLVYAWIAQNVFLLFSTIWRLAMYVEVYSLSRWRVAAMIWIGLVAIGFGWVIWKILWHKTNVWLLRVNFATLASVLYVSTFVNFSGMIADFNVRHCKEVDGQGVPLDAAYLQSLDVEALPALTWVEPRVADGTKRVVKGAEKSLKKELDEELGDWRGWTFRRQRIVAALESPQPNSGIGTRALAEVQRP